MTINGWIQIAVYCALILSDEAARRSTWRACSRASAPSLTPVLAPVERGILSAVCGVDAKTRAALDDATRWPCCCSASSSFLARLRAAAAAGYPAVQPAGHRRRLARTSAFNTAVSFTTNTNWQGYGGETTMSYLDADGRADGAELRLGRRRHRARHRADPRLRAALGADRRQFLGRSHALRCSTCCCRSRSWWRWRWSRSACRRTCTPIPTRHAGRRKAADRPGPGRLADRHQAARHQRRRLLQRQLGPSVREPERRSPT